MIRFAIYLCTWFITMPMYGLGVIRNGGDVLIIGEKTLLFDEVEYSQTFFPTGLGKPWDILEQQLELLEAHLPLTAAYFQSILGRGRVTWALVEVSLKPIEDEGESNLILISKDKKQLAANFGNLVQINKELWDSLQDRSRAMVLAHEALWIANNSEALYSGSQVRQLVGLFFDENLDQYLTENLINTLLSIFERGAYGEDRRFQANSSKMVQLIKLDAQRHGRKNHFLPLEIQDGRSTDLVLQVQADDLQGLQVSAINIGGLIRGLRIESNGLITAEIAGIEESVSISGICESITYAGARDWVLPTSPMIWRLAALGLLQERYPQSKRLNELALRTQPFGSSTTAFQMHQVGHFSLDPVVPTTTANKSDARLLTAEGSLFNLNQRLKDETLRYHGDLEVICVRQSKGGSEQ